MKRIIITLICILMTLSLYAANNSIFEGSTPDSASDTPTQTIELTIGDELYKYSVGFSTDGSKPSEDISENTKLELSSDDKTIAVNTSELYVWWDIMTADAFDVTLKLDGALTQQDVTPEDSAAKIQFSVNGAIQEGEVKPSGHDTDSIDIASDGTTELAFLDVDASVGDTAHTYQGKQKLTITTGAGELANKPEGKYTANLTLKVTNNQ